MIPPLTIEEMREIAKDHGGECLSEEYKNQNTNLMWKCKDGHIWNAMPSNVKNGKTWCPLCACHIRLTIEDVQELAKSKGGVCLSKEYVNNHTKLRWKCKEGHEWEATQNSIKMASWCPYCVGRNQTIQDMKRIAEQKKGKCLSTIYVNSTTKLKWQCEYNHEWWAIPSSIKIRNWCPECAKKTIGDALRKKTIKDMQNLAESRGGKCLSEFYKNAHTKLKWQCKIGHIWDATPNHIRLGTWCPHCNVKIRERICRDFFERIFDAKFPKKYPKWLKNPETGRLLELDGYNEKLKLAFEHQGKQHYTSTMLYSNGERFDAMLERDELKRKICIKNDITLIEIPYQVKLEKMPNYIIKQCKKKEVKVPKIRLDMFAYNITKAYNPNRLKEMQEIAKSRDGECLSTQYIGAREKHTWKCSEGHIWDATFGSIKNGTWCKICGFKKISKSKTKYTIEDMQKIAKEKGGKCLSNEYLGPHIKLKWQCERGHIWETYAHIVINMGCWCPHCPPKSLLTIEEMQNIAKDKGGQCLSTKYITSKVKLIWMCKCGYIWLAEPRNIKSGQWCPKCSAKRGAEKRRKLKKI